ncbi:MAG: hypothetical protein AAF078_12440 [Planctomycetota bacterium]
MTRTESKTSPRGAHRGWLIGGVLALIVGLLLPAATVSAESGCHNRPPKTHDIGVEPQRD